VCAVGRVPRAERSNPPDAAAPEFLMQVPFIASALCVLGVLLLRPIVSLVAGRFRSRS